MQIQFSYKQVNNSDKNFLEKYIEKKRDRLRTLIPNDLLSEARLEIRTEKFAKKEAYQVEIYLSLPGQNFRSSEDNHTVIEAFDLALDKLIIQMRRERDKIKK